MASAQVGTRALKVIRTFLRQPIGNMSSEVSGQYTLAINYFTLKATVGDFGIRMFGIQLIFASVSSLLSLWATLLGAVYAINNNQK